MIVKYGDYSFANGECAMTNFRVMPQRTRMGLRRSAKVRMDCAGEFCFDGSMDQDDIKTKIIAAQTAFNEDYKDLILFHNDGTTESPYKLDNDHPTNITGNLVTHVAWPSTAPEDYATTKAFNFGVEAEFVNPNLTLLDFQQGIKILGTAGPVGKWERLINGQWIRKLIHPSSTKLIVQSGQLISFGSYLPAPPPILSELYEHQERRILEQVGPSLFYARPEFYTTRWTYVFETPLEYTPLNTYPVIY